MRLFLLLARTVHPLLIVLLLQSPDRCCFSVLTPLPPPRPAPGHWPSQVHFRDLKPAVSSAPNALLGIRLDLHPSSFRCGLQCRHCYLCPSLPLCSRARLTDRLAYCCPPVFTYCQSPHTRLQAPREVGVICCVLTLSPMPGTVPGRGRCSVNTC